MDLLASVIIPNYNRGQALQLTLQALGKQSLEASTFEVIVVDDGSQDNSLKLLTEHKPTYPFSFFQQANQGPGAARNKGAIAAKSNLFIFLDADMIAEANLVAEYLRFHAKHPRTVIIGRQLPYLPAYPNITRDFYHSFIAYDLGEYPIKPAFHALAAGNFAVDNISFKALHGFDENFRMAEDVEFGYRAEKFGISIFYHPKALGFHNHPKKLGELYQQRQVSGWWTAQLIHKHPTILGQIPIYRALEPINIQRDSIYTIIKKLVFWFYSSRPGLTMLILGKNIFRSVIQNPRIFQHLLLRILMANMRIGFNKGLRGKPI